MIRSIEINGLRGIKDGKLDDLAPLSILVGPNGSGKSTVLDALLIAASNDTPDAIARAVQRRVGVKRGARWLIWRGTDEVCRLAVQRSDGSDSEWSLWLESAPGTDTVSGESPREGNAGLTASVSWQTKSDQVAGRSFHVGVLAPQPQGRHRFRAEQDLNTRAQGVQGNSSPEVRLVDAHYYDAAKPLHQLYTRVVEQGRGREAKQLIAAALKGVVDIEILTEGDTPVVHLVFADHSVPAAVAGDGVQMVLRLSLELASRSGGLVLLEEPEVHQHPGTIRQSALAILASIRRGVQVVLTTHSLELIDALLSQASEDDLKQIAVFRVQLEDGVLKSSRLPGPEAAFARSQIEDDLR